MKCVSVCFVLGIMEEWVTYKLVNCNLLYYDLVNYDLVKRN